MLSILKSLKKKILNNPVRKTISFHLTHDDIEVGKIN